MFPTLLRRAAQEARPSNPAFIRQIRELYPPKKVWPPDFKRLSVQEQLRFEKKYKRRLALATSRPRWNKLMKLVQLFSITSVVFYAVLFMDWQTEKHPFDGVRKGLWSFMGLDYKPSSTRPTQRIQSEAGLPQIK